MTPMMDQYYRIKAQYPDALLLYRMGDFYETFDEDAKVAAKVLGLQLTARAHGLAEKTPLAGVPYHALDRYLKQLVAAGYKVAVCEQIEDPKLAKGVVKRAVTEVLTPGTITLDGIIPTDQGQYVLALSETGPDAHVAWADLTTGLFRVTTVPIGGLAQIVAPLEAREWCVPEGTREMWEARLVEAPSPTRITELPPMRFRVDRARDALHESLRVTTLEGFGAFEEGEVSAAGALIAYIHELKLQALPHLARLERIAAQSGLVIDPFTLRNLELLRTADGDESNGLLAHIRRTVTSGGARALRGRLLAPLSDPAPLNAHYHAIAAFLDDEATLDRLRELLSNTADLARIASKLGYGKAGPRDLWALATTLRAMPDIVTTCSALDASLIADTLAQLPDLAHVAQRIESTLADDAPGTLIHGGVVRVGFDATLDELRAIRADQRAFLEAMQSRERERTGIGTLKVAYNSVHGFFVEVGKAASDKMPGYYRRLQTLVSAERYTTPELAEFARKVETAEAESLALEARIYAQLTAELLGALAAMQSLAEALATLDLVQSLAFRAREGGWVRPTLTLEPTLTLRGGRHPVVEALVASGRYVPNDCVLDATTRLWLITGPNMAGKSTFLRMVGVVALLAHMGSYVPAEELTLGPIDRIFTRVGATDRQSRGQSTFMVEMIETAAILQNASDHSLILLDEVGRGTSTFDGLSIAWAMTEYLHSAVRARTLFATHYHELTQLGESLGGAANYQVAVRDWGDSVIFLHTIVPGGCDDSYGLHVASMAGVPPAVIKRAKEVLAALESHDLVVGGASSRLAPRSESMQISLFAPIGHPLADELRTLDVDALTPLEALQRLHLWKRRCE